jgi:hypothetical protein
MQNGFMDSVAKLITSPPAQFVSGGVLAGVVWKLSERIESLLTDTTKLELAVWLRGVNLGEKVEPWPLTFAAMFDTIFGSRYLSLKCFWRSAVVTILGLLGSAVIGSSLDAQYVVIEPYMWLSRPYVTTGTPASRLLLWALGILLGAIIPGYIALMETRFVLSLMKRTTSGFLWAALLVLDLALTLLVGSISRYFIISYDYAMLSSLEAGHLTLGSFLLSSPLSIAPRNITWDVIILLPLLLTSAWLWLHAASGLLLSGVHRFDVGFQWFNRRFDIEKKPLQSIGLVGGTLVASTYWLVAILSHSFR